MSKTFMGVSLRRLQAFQMAIQLAFLEATDIDSLINDAGIEEHETRGLLRIGLASISPARSCCPMATSCVRQRPSPMTS